MSVLPSLAAGVWSGTITTWDVAAASGCLVSLGGRGAYGLEGRQVWLGAQRRNAASVAWYEAAVVATFMSTEIALAGVTPLSIEPRREAVRASLRGCATLTFRGGAKALAEVADISSGGCRLVMPVKALPRVGQEVAVDLFLGVAEVTTWATITRVQGTGPATVALRFDRLGARYQEAIDRAVLARLSAARR